MTFATRNRNKYSLGLLSGSMTLLGMGVTWSVVIFYRYFAKGIAAELGNVLLAAVGIGFGFTLLTYAYQKEVKLIPLLLMGTAASLPLGLGLATLGNV